MAEQMTAIANGKGMGISTKYAIEVCAFLRGRKLVRAKAILEAVLKKEQAIPFRRFTDGVGHRTSTPAAGRYPKKASEEILMLLKSAESNAINKEMTGELEIVELHCNKANTPMRYGRHSRRQTKRTNVWVTLGEIEGTRKERKAKKAESKVEPKVTPKTETQVEAKPSLKDQMAATSVKPTVEKTEVKTEKANPKSESKTEKVAVQS